ncbi:hypothetical protein AGABI2DRAFT_116763 [Agaricus bisporus var. bisporus H97]|uniref:hypothetical protein n=1 Tax=Agaricus bisporus var. bisporus (strain H97 / ATCC MYA-4626 / FGSC 10389) TaxID=936046 RepID=UPI00029F5064|nr:hypothetical protein AGABI2DRAFT_116763 [Agaricus bisporus var. bisporus H97]EKV47958.1 hypothetical protein AGABI2DRAFT_116763 [Agaricus bisporus var. bisporus H97]
MSEPFNVSDISGDWKKLGAGSFGNVYKGPLLSPHPLPPPIPLPGNYLGIDVTIKEVLPSKDYDVAKNTVTPTSASSSASAALPNPTAASSSSLDSSTTTTSVYTSTTSQNPFPGDSEYPLQQMSLVPSHTSMPEICIHRDLKGENLLVTSNGRIKVTDFGFARIAARNAEGSKRLTFCGTDSYMSPESFATPVTPPGARDSCPTSIEFKMPLVAAKEVPGGSKHTPVISFRAKYQSYHALRQCFWRQYMKWYDADGTGALSHIEITFRLGSLGSTLSSSSTFFTHYGKGHAKTDCL